MDTHFCGTEHSLYHHFLSSGFDNLLDSPRSKYLFLFPEGQHVSFIFFILQHLLPNDVNTTGPGDRGQVHKSLRRSSDKVIRSTGFMVSGSSATAHHAI